MEMTIRPMTATERMYCYSQSQQIMAQTGCIGHLRGDMGSSGEQFFSSWDDHQSQLKTQEFKDEFDAVINALRFDEAHGGVLASRRALANYCWDHPDSRMVPGEDDFGFRLDTENYSYLLRLNPNRGMYNIYCYCYQREWLDNHLQNAAKGIRFIDSHYNEKFRVPDGEKVRIITAGGEHRDMRVRYIDDYHIETNADWGNTYIISASSQSDLKSVAVRTSSRCGPLYRTDVIVSWSPQEISLSSKRAKRDIITSM